MANALNVLSVEEVAVSVGVSVQTINIWYRWKKQNPDNERAKLLPDFIQMGARQTRYWQPTDVVKIMEFKNTVTVGRHGVMGDVTQRYVRERKNGR